MPKINYQGREIDALDIDFKSVREDWNEYNLNDGSILRVKLILAGVIRIPDEYDNEGNPIYIIKTTNMVVAKSPDDLKRK